MMPTWLIKLFVSFVSSFGWSVYHLDVFKFQITCHECKFKLLNFLYRYPIFVVCCQIISFHWSILNRAADLPQESSCSVGVFNEGAEVWYSIKNTFWFRKWFGKVAFAFWAMSFGFLVSTENHYFKTMVAISTFVFDSRHEGISEWSSYGYIESISLLKYNYHNLMLSGQVNLINLLVIWMTLKRTPGGAMAGG